MGAILEMTVSLKAGFVLSICLMLAGCGTETQSPAKLVLQSVGSIFQTGAEGPPPGPDDLLTRDVIDRVVVPYAMVGIERRGAYASMTLAGTNADDESWVTSDGAGVYLRNDILTGTKGLGADLLTADLGAMRANLNTGSGNHQRVHRFLDGEGRIFAESYECSVTTMGQETIEIIGEDYMTRVVAENCTNSKVSFENRYWLGVRDGVMWQSRQWVSVGVGHVILLTLVDVAR
jgi:hypothetical protein